MVRVISFISIKGGVGKSTGILNTAHALALMGYKVLVIDFDFQRSISDNFGVHNDDLNIYKALIDECDINDCIFEDIRDNLDLIPSHNQLYFAPDRFKQLYFDGEDYVLRQKLKKIEKNYDFIFIDGRSEINSLFKNVFLACTDFIIPIRVEFMGMRAIKYLFEIISKSHHRPHFIGFLLNDVNKRRKATGEIINYLEKERKKDLLKTRIPSSTKIQEAFKNKKTVLDYPLKTRGHQEFLDLAKEIIKRIQT